MEKELKAFIRNEIAVAKENDIEVIFENKAFVKLCGMECTGYFDEVSLLVATKRPLIEWVPTFIHETCHMDQFLSKSRHWLTDIRGKKGRHDALGIFDQYVDEVISLTEDQKYDVLTKTISVEWDCEKRTVRKIKKNHLDFDLDDYIQKANMYCFLYTYNMKKQHWYNLVRLYKKNPNLVKVMPIKFFKSVEDYINIPTDIWKEFEKASLDYKY